jgi:MtaA/CmuA family methyltransferase
MTGRERMKLAMKRGPTDRTAFMPQFCHPHAISLFYDDYRKGIADVVERPETMHELAIRTALHYGVDGLRLFRTGESYKVEDDGEVMKVFDPESGRKIGIVDVLGGGGVILDSPPGLVEKEEDLKSIDTPDKSELRESDWFRVLKKSVFRARNEGLFAVSSPPGFTMNYVSEKRGRDRALIDVIDNPPLVHSIMDKGLEISLAYAEVMLETGIDCFYIGDPSSSASLISPAHFREFCLPRFKTFCDELHRKDVLIYIHICGKSGPLLEMLADTGTDCVEPLDPLGGVDIADAKERVGDRICLMGGLNTVTILEKEPEKVYQEARGCCEKGGKTGYILAAGDMVPDFSPEENVKAMIKAAKDFKTS